MMEYQIVPDSDAREAAAKEFLVQLPALERINALKKLTKDTTKMSEGNLMKEYRQRPRVNAVRIIKVEMEQNKKIDVEKVALSVLLAMAICVAVQWLFGKCSRRKPKDAQ